MARITQNKNESINPIPQHGRVVDYNCCVVFPISQIVQMEGSYLLLIYKD